MNPPASRLLAAVIFLTSPGVVWCADANGVAPFRTDRVERAHRQFADVHFVMGSGQAMEWLEMYVGSNLVAAFRDFDAEEVHASSDGQYFLAISNKAGSSMAFAVLDRDGRLVFSSPHGADGLRYCTRTSSHSWNWINAARPAVRFEVDRIPWATPARHYLKAVTVQGCDGKDLLLGKAGPPRDPVIIDPIRNLRGLDPRFSSRTLTLSEGRRPVTTAPTSEEAARQAQPAD